MRTKQEITKSVYIRFRIEPKLRKQYFTFCKQNKYILSKRIRNLVEQDMIKNKN